MKIYALLFTMLVFCSGFSDCFTPDWPSQQPRCGSEQLASISRRRRPGLLDGDGDLLPKRWSASENVAWKTNIPGRGWSSPIVWETSFFSHRSSMEVNPRSPKRDSTLAVIAQNLLAPCTSGRFFASTQTPVTFVGSGKYTRDYRRHPFI